MCARPLLGLAYVGEQERPGLSLCLWQALLPAGRGKCLGERWLSVRGAERTSPSDERLRVSNHDRCAKNRGNWSMLPVEALHGSFQKPFPFLLYFCLLFINYTVYILNYFFRHITFKRKSVCVRACTCIFCVCACVHKVRGALCRWGDNFVALALSFHLYMSSGAQTEVTRLCSVCLS